MKPRVSLCRFKLPFVLAAGLVLYHGWFVAAVTVCAPGNSARVRQCNRTHGYSQSGEGERENNLDCYGHHQQESSDRRYRHFFSMANCRWVAAGGRQSAGEGIQNGHGDIDHDRVTWLPLGDGG